ncbi:hypothetical protein M5J07_20750 [Achromobacter mucicolens]|uniref:hypothetical protein n=1 Tax=Achromobacter mucicolens TaxID=1389922 RepID=UPI0020A4204E|nr:hypothetical protein [Achromobacter mucicolens]MCP2517381.1 hypothetical protein [Achromobacter mucicolens]
MPQEQIIDAIGKHLDSLESLINWTIVVALGAAWAGIQRSSELSLGGMTIKRTHSFLALAIGFILVNLALLIGILRLTALIELLHPDFAERGLIAISTHKWLLNPFAYFGGSLTGRAVSSAGYGLLIVIWWLCNSALFSLLDGRNTRVFQYALRTFLALGLLSMLAIQWAAVQAFEKLEFAATELRDGVLSTGVERAVIAGAGIALGAAIYAHVVRLTTRRGKA